MDFEETQPFTRVGEYRFVRTGPGAFEVFRAGAHIASFANLTLRLLDSDTAWVFADAPTSELMFAVAEHLDED